MSNNHNAVRLRAGIAESVSGRCAAISGSSRSPSSDFDNESSRNGCIQNACGCRPAESVAIRDVRIRNRISLQNGLDDHRNGGKNDAVARAFRTYWRCLQIVDAQTASVTSQTRGAIAFAMPADTM